MAESLTKALWHTQNNGTRRLLAEVRPHTAVKQSMDEWDAGMAAAGLSQNEITLSQLATLVRSVTSRMSSDAARLAPDGITRRSVARSIEQLTAAINDLQSVAAEPPHMMAAE